MTKIYTFNIILLLSLSMLSTECKSQIKNTMQLTSPAFKHNELIPAKYTCKGANISPALLWTGAPVNTKTFVLICDDPDAPMKTFIHWVLYNIPASTTSLKEHIQPTNTLSDGSIHGTTDFGRVGYGGPCPPSGIHRYFFKLYALDIKLNLMSGATKEQVLKAIEGHIIATSELIGKFIK